MAWRESNNLRSISTDDPDLCPGSGKAPVNGRCPDCQQIAFPRKGGLIAIHLRPIWKRAQQVTA